MKLHDHPVMAPLYGVGVPAWCGLAIGGPIGAFVCAVVAGIGLLFAWRRGA